MLVTFPKTDEELYREAEDRFLNESRVMNDLNLIESPSLVPTTQSAIKSFKPFLRLQSLKNFGTASRSLRLGSAAKLGDLVAGGFLSYQFGVAPLVSDMRKMVREIGSIKDQMARINRVLERPVRVSAETTGTLGFGDPSQPGTPVPEKLTQFSRSRLQLLEAPKRRCVISGRYPHQYGSDTFKSIQYYLNRYGFSGPAGLIWELIPYSFVVDWFIDTSSIINHLNQALSLDRKLVDRVSFSTKWKCLTTCSHLKGDARASNIDNVDIMWHTMSYYHRKPGQYHVSHTGLASGRFGKKQVALSAALLYAAVSRIANRLR